MKDRKTSDKTAYSNSDMTYSQQLLRGKHSKLMLGLQNVLSKILLIVLLLVLSLFILFPVTAYIIYDTETALIIICSVIVIISCIIPIRALSKRKKLLKALKHFGSDIRVDYASGKYSSLFNASGKLDFTVETQTAVFGVMIFPVVLSGYRLRFSPDGKSVTFVSRIFLGKLGRLLGIKPIKKNSALIFDAKPPAEIEKPFKKILLLSPVPKNIEVWSKDERRVIESGPGEVINDFTVENIAGFSRLIGYSV